MQPIKQFNQTIEISCYSKSTIKSYKYHIKQFLIYYNDDLREENIEKHLYYLKTKKNYSSESLNLARASLIYFFNKILKKPITIEILKIKRKKSLPRPIERETIIKLIQNTYNLKHRILIELVYSSGIRPFEAIKVKWNDIDFINKTIRINQGKGKKDRISILSDFVIPHLLDLKESKPNNNDYVFFSQARPKTHISKKTFQKILENGSIKAKLDFIVTPYQLRHSFATHSLEDGTDIRHIQELMGHSSTKTTEIYTRVTKKKLSQIRSPLDNIKIGLTPNKNVKDNNKNGEKVVNTNDKV